MLLLNNVHPVLAKLYGKTKSPTDTSGATREVYSELSNQPVGCGPTICAWAKSFPLRACASLSS